MTDPSVTSAQPAAKNSIVRRIAASAMIGLIFFCVLWYAVFNAVTAVLVASGGTAVLLTGASLSDTVETIFNMIANILLGILATIGAFFSSLFD